MKEKLIQAVCDMYNNLDIKCIEGLSDDNLVYESQWVLSAMTGRAEIEAFLANKFDLIKKSNAKLMARISFIEDDNNLILVRQGEQTIGVVLKMKNDKITRIDIVNPQFFTNQ